MINPPQIPERKPVMSGETKKEFPDDQIDREWLQVTEIIRRRIIADPEMRKKVAHFATVPVTESLPKEFLEAIVLTNSIIKELIEVFRIKIIKYVSLPPVPDELIQPDITNASNLLSVKGVVENLQKDLNDETVEKTIQKFAEQGIFTKGITWIEKEMILRRYRFAREVKLLALQAELIENQDNLQARSDSEIALPSGIRIHLNAANDRERENLLNPELWKKRRQLKDRVYEVQIGDKKYILKEKKTARHAHTQKRGHKDGNTSIEEFNVAKIFQERGTYMDDEIIISWERPIVAVTYPDGFQFTMYEFREGLQKKMYDGLFDFEKIILENPERFREEYECIKAAIKKRTQPKKIPVLSPEAVPSASPAPSPPHDLKLHRFLKFMGLKQDKKREEPPPEPEMPELTYKEYARVKIERIYNKLEYYRKKLIAENEYSNYDQDGFILTIDGSGDKPRLNMFGFDFEYFEKIDPERQKSDIDWAENQWKKGNPYYQFKSEIEKMAYEILIEIDTRKTD